MRGGGVQDGLGFDLADDFGTIRFRNLYKRTNLAISVESTTTTLLLLLLLLLVKGSPTDNDGQVCMGWNRCASPPSL